MDNTTLEKLYTALRTIGTDETIRARFVTLCQEVESKFQYKGGSIRDDITAPIMDALHSNVDIVQKRISSGEIFEFRPCSKIAREFVMSKPEIPNHVWEPQTTRLLLHLARQARNVLVGGAYFGDQAILLARQLAQTGGTCHAFEPDPNNHSMLMRNAHLNDLTNLIGNQMGLWDTQVDRLAFIGQDELASSQVATDLFDGLTFSATSIDIYIKEQSIDSVELIVLDIEGIELRALRGAVDQLSLPKGQAPNLVFEIHRSYTDWSKGLRNTDVIEFLSSFNYEIFCLRDFQGNYDMGERPIELVYLEETYLEGPPHGFNLVAVKDASILQGDLFKYCSGVSPKLLIHKDPSLHHPTDGL